MPQEWGTPLVPSIAGPESRRKWVSVPCSGTLEFDIPAPALRHFLLQAEESSNLYILLGISTGVGEWLETPRANSQDDTGSTARSEEK